MCLFGYIFSSYSQNYFLKKNCDNLCSKNVQLLQELFKNFTEAPCLGFFWASQIYLWPLINFGKFLAFISSSFCLSFSSPTGTSINVCSVVWYCPADLGGPVSFCFSCFVCLCSIWIVSNDSFPCSWVLCSVHSLLVNHDLPHFPFVLFYSLGGVSDGGGGASEDPLFHKSNEDAQSLFFFFRTENWPKACSHPEGQEKMVNLSKDSEPCGISKCPIPILLSPAKQWPWKPAHTFMVKPSSLGRRGRCGCVSPSIVSESSWPPGL